MKQDNLFETKEPWQEEWVGMPEFEQDEEKVYAKFIVRIDSEELLKEFSEMIGQNLTPATKSIRHPRVIRGVNSNKRWVDGA